MLCTGGERPGEQPRILSLNMGRDYDVVAQHRPDRDAGLAAAKRTPTSSGTTAGGGRRLALLTADRRRSGPSPGRRFPTLWTPSRGSTLIGGHHDRHPEEQARPYFYGVEYPARTSLGLIEASANRIGSPIDQILLLCYHYDPKTGKYNFAVIKALQVLGSATVRSRDVHVRDVPGLAPVKGRGRLSMWDFLYFRSGPPRSPASRRLYFA
ncbi:MAG: hypothetical protein WKF75_13135 [Singulisphaera sp.]